MLIGGLLFSFPNISLVTQDKEKDLKSMKQVFGRECADSYSTPEQVIYDSNLITLWTKSQYWSYSSKFKQIRLQTTAKMKTC